MAGTFSSRPLDAVYFCYFLLCIPITLFVDLQSLYPSHLVPEYLKLLPNFYIQMSNDPLIKGVAGLIGAPNEYTWFHSFLFIEALFQLPSFFICAYGLYKGSKKVYPLLIAFGASTATTVLPCLFTIINAPRKSTEETFSDLEPIGSITDWERTFILANYAPFLFVPLLMAVDVSLRVYRILAEADVGHKDATSVKHKSQ